MTPLRSVSRALARFASVMALILIIAAAAGIGYEQFARVSAASSVAPPVGEIVCRGSGSPVVLMFSTGYLPASVPWPTVQPEVEQFATVCERTGVTPTDHRPLSGERMVGELHDMLEAAGVSSPYVVVGWSAGGLVTRWFDARYRDEVAGFVFVDSSHPDMRDRPPPPIDVPIWVAPILLETGVLRALANDGLPAWLSQRLIRRPRQRDQLAAYLVFHEILRQSRKAPAEPHSLGSRPVVILTREGAPRSWVRFQEELATLSDNARHTTVRGAGHQIHEDEPEAVVEAIRDVVLAARSGARLSNPGSP
jgi:pimeloyl-ACP methyl ester carboxylesterase